MDFEYRYNLRDRSPSKGAKVSSVYMIKKLQDMHKKWKKDNTINYEIMDMIPDIVKELQESQYIKRDAYLCGLMMQELGKGRALPEEK